MQEYWNGLPCPPPGDLPKPGIWLSQPVSLFWPHTSPSWPWQQTSSSSVWPVEGGLGVIAALFVLGSRGHHTQPSSEPLARIPHPTALPGLPGGQGGAMSASPPWLEIPFMVSGVGRNHRMRDLQLQVSWCGPTPGSSSHSRESHVHLVAANL